MKKALQRFFFDLRDLQDRGTPCETLFSLLLSTLSEFLNIRESRGALYAGTRTTLTLRDSGDHQAVTRTSQNNPGGVLIPPCVHTVVYTLHLLHGLR